MTTESIRMLIREMLLTEAMFTPERAFEEGITFKVTRTPFGKGGWDIMCFDSEGIRMGAVKIARPLGRGKCLDAYEVYNAVARRDAKIGPLLYDIAMEISGENGLMSDRGIVSKYAMNVWKYYLDNRTDVEHTQLDSSPGTITPYDESDDCTQYSSKRDPVGWQNSALSKVYKKRGTPVIDKLKELGIIEIM